MLGEKLRDMGYGTGLYPESDYVCGKVPVFSCQKLRDVDTQLGPEMKSTGEVLGVAKTLPEAIYKGLVAAGYKMKREGGVLLTVRDADKHDIVPIADKFASMGFTLYATGGTALRLNKNMISTNAVRLSLIHISSLAGNSQLSFEKQKSLCFCCAQTEENAILACWRAAAEWRLQWNKRKKHGWFWPTAPFWREPPSARREPPLEKLYLLLA